MLGPDGLSRFEELSHPGAARTAILYAFDLIERTPCAAMTATTWCCVLLSRKTQRLLQSAFGRLPSPQR
jgi:hypothetical protein